VANIGRELRALSTGLAIGLAAAAVAREMEKPPEERTWHGKVAWIVPYDYRLPTLRRIRDTYWNPEDPHILTSQVFGVGWTVNLHALFHRLANMLCWCSGQQSTSTKSG